MPIQHGDDPNAQGRQTVVVLLIGATAFLGMICMVGYVQSFLENPGWGIRFIVEFFMRLFGG